MSLKKALNKIAEKHRAFSDEHNPYEDIPWHILKVFNKWQGVVPGSDGDGACYYDYHVPGTGWCEDHPPPEYPPDCLEWCYQEPDSPLCQPHEYIRKCETSTEGECLEDHGDENPEFVANQNCMTV